ncbi:MAG: hypothetical protein M1812_002106 [Candelaria pacifica]|nr:MAG: hypothetical protein M1812_002106 [Candelaria pacifica]
MSQEKDPVQCDTGHPCLGFSNSSISLAVRRNSTAHDGDGEVDDDDLFLEHEACPTLPGEKSLTHKRKRSLASSEKLVFYQASSSDSDVSRGELKQAADSAISSSSGPNHRPTCASLIGGATHTTANSSSRGSAPSPRPRLTPRCTNSTEPPPEPFSPPAALQHYESPNTGTSGTAQSHQSKHTLLSTTANDDPQQRFKGPQSPETYRPCKRYILTVLDQKMNGIGDPLLCTMEEVEIALDSSRPEAALERKGGERDTALTAASSTTHGTPTAERPQFSLPQGFAETRNGTPGPPMINTSQAVGWALTNTMSSANPNLTPIYQTSEHAATGLPSASSSGASMLNENLLPEIATAAATCMTAALSQSPGIPYAQTPMCLPYYSATHSNYLQPSPRNTIKPGPQSSTYTYPLLPSEITTTPDAELLAGLHSPYKYNTIPLTTNSLLSPIPPQKRPSQPDFTQSLNPSSNPLDFVNQAQNSISFGDMMIGSQDIDMSVLGSNPMSYVDHLSQNVLDHLFG